MAKPESAMSKPEPVTATPWPPPPPDQFQGGIMHQRRSGGGTFSRELASLVELKNTSIVGGERMCVVGLPRKMIKTDKIGWREGVRGAHSG